MKKLLVQQAQKEDVYKDIVRVAETFRKNEREETIKAGMVCKMRLKSNKKWIYSILRGMNEKNSFGSSILIDDALREKLGIKLGREYEFVFKKIGWWSWWRWAWDATDPGYQISLRIALISLILGGAGLIFGVISLLL